ncbi:apolipoprotein D [Folsomia candida]|uniref:Apolipoprotein D n=1 Tax=Folsomia candida TaxID=158441 RepID=A0A226DLP3_FOLCA|nr:apolipoprotein D [Folsomia candida]XP_035713185.1 apolipoprotein D [Folsomia candida]OXA45521.1 Apolipoprotein D [Folsomia candida]
MHRREVLVVTFLVSTLFAFSDAHTMGLGSCPRVEPLKDFNMDKFLGEWYVIQKFATSSSCMKYNFTQGTDGKLRLVQTRQHFLLDTIGVDHIYTYTGVLTIPDNDRSARMRVKFPLNIAGEADFLVFMTDYSSYAGIFTCQKILFGHTKSATILSRKPTLDKAVVNQVRQKLEEEGVDPDDFSVVDQDTCRTKEDSSLNVKIDDKTFSAQNIGGVVKKVGQAVGTGIDKAGEVLGSGISKASDVTGDIVESFADKEDKKTAPIKSLNELLDKAKVQENEAEWLP